MKTAVDLGLACASVALVMLVSRQLQTPTPVVVWDAGQYYTVAKQFAAGRTPHAESPYVFRVGVPWLVSSWWPGDSARGFFIVNVVSAFAIAILLMLWLKAWAIDRWIAIAVVTLVAAAWHGPMRYIYYNPGYVDPPFIALLILGLWLIHRIERTGSVAAVALLTLLSAVGALVRETMLLVPLCFLLVNNPLSAFVAGRRRPLPVPAWAIVAPLAACAAAIVFTHRIVTVDMTERASMVQAAWQWLHKAPDSYVMGWLTAFGPVLAIVAFDWRRALRLLRDHEWLGALVAGCVALSFIGGSDTERFAFWSMPVVYLLVARAVERYPRVFASASIVTALTVAQAVASRVFWGIPDPHSESVTALASDAGWFGRIYGAANRLFVIDSFHFNLWSSFGSRPFRLLRIALYLVVIGGLTWAMQRARNREVAIGALGGARYGTEHGAIVE